MSGGERNDTMTDPTHPGTAHPGIGMIRADMPGARKAALLSVLMGEQVSADVLKHLEEDEVHVIGREMARIQSVTSPLKSGT